MGLLFTSEATSKILDTLNTAFDGPNKGLQYIRDQVDASLATDKKLYNMLDKKKWRPGHLAWSLKLFPYDQRGNNDASDFDKARWAYFLKKVVGPQQFSDICTKLSEVILKRGVGGKIARIRFDHKEGSPNLFVYDAPIGNDLNGPYVRYMTLITANAEDGKVDNFDPPDGGDADQLPKPPWQTPR